MTRLALLLVLASASFAEPFLLQKNDRVVLYGDSITEQRLYTRYLQQYVYCRYPQHDIRFYNAGWGGDTAHGAYERLTRDVLSLKPTVVTLFFGMNDGRYRGPDKSVLNDYRERMTLLVKTLKEQRVRVIVFTPGCVDEDRRDHLRGYNKTLQALARIATKIAQKHDCPVVDLHAPMLAFQAARKRENDKYTMIPDAVHPNANGHRVMARWMLAGLGAEPMPALGKINVGDGSAVGLQLVKRSDERIELRTLAKAATPFWFSADAAATMRESGFIDALAGERLQVAGLPRGKYDVAIKGHVCGTYTAAQLARGVAVAGWDSARGRAAHDLIEKKELMYYRTWRELRLPFEEQPGIDATVAALLKADDALHEMIRGQCQPSAPLTITLTKAPSGKNLALGKAYECSDPNGYKWGEGGLTDGSWLGDRRHCFSTGDGGAFPKHVVVDLEKTVRVGAVRIGVPNFGSTRTVVVSVSRNNKSFKEVGRATFDQRRAQRATVRFKSVSARYIRLTYPDRHDQRVHFPPNFCFTTELEVYPPQK